MAIKLDKETEERLIASIQRYFDANMDDSIGDLKAGMLLDFLHSGNRSQHLQLGDCRCAVRDAGQGGGTGRQLLRSGIHVLEQKEIAAPIALTQ